MSESESRVSARQVELGRYSATLAGSYFKEAPGLFNWGILNQVPEPGAHFAALVEVEWLPELGRYGLRSWRGSSDSDMFVSTELTPEESRLLAAYVGRPLSAHLIMRAPLAHILHGVIYEVEPTIQLAMVPYNPTLQEMDDLEQGLNVIIEGEVTDCSPMGDLFNLELTNSVGRYAMPIPRGEFGRPVYFGNQRSITVEPVVLGEIARVVATKGDRWIDAEDQFLYRVAVADVYPRQYQQLRCTVDRLLRKLEAYAASGRYRKARALFAQLLNHRLTQGEAAQAFALMGRLPESERSMQTSAPGQQREFYGYFGTWAERYNKAEFLAFAQAQLAAGPDSPAWYGFENLVYYLIESQLSGDEVAPLLLANLPRYAQIMQDESDLIAHTLLHVLIDHMSSSGHPLLANLVTDLVERSIEQGYFPREDVPEIAPPLLDGKNEHLLALLGVVVHWTIHAQPAAALVSREQVAGWRGRLSEAGAELSLIKRCDEILQAQGAGRSDSVEAGAES